MKSHGCVNVLIIHFNRDPWILYLYTHTHIQYISLSKQGHCTIFRLLKNLEKLILCMNCEVNPLLFCAVNKSSRCLAKFNLLSQNAELDTSQLSLQWPHICNGNYNNISKSMCWLSWQHLIFSSVSGDKGRGATITYCSILNRLWNSKPE